MVFIVIFDLFAKYIVILYLMMVVSNLAVFLVFVHIASNTSFGISKTPGFQVLHYGFIAAYVLCAALAIYPGTSC